MNKSNDFEKLLKFEKKLSKKLGTTCPGTTLARCLLPGEGSGIGWTFGIGVMSMPMKWFVDETIEGNIKQAEKWLKKWEI